MATILLSPTSLFPPKSPAFSIHAHHISQRIRTVRFATHPSRNRHVSSNEWPFEQRMEEALHLLDLMETRGMSPDPSLFCILLQSCADAENFEIGKTIHQKIMESKFLNNVFVTNNLINMYAKCGCMKDARQVFDEMPARNIISWTTIISMYSQLGFPKEALRLYRSMKSSGKISPNAFTYTIALNSCAKICNWKMGVEIHEDIVRDGCESDAFVVTALIDMYGKCGRIDDAHGVFDQLSEPSAAACTAMIEGYNLNNQAKEALCLIKNILQWDARLEVAKELGFACMIRSCSLEAALKQGQEIHAHMIKFGYKPGSRTITALIELYEKCGKMETARHLFNELLVKDVSLWGRMVSGYVRNGLCLEALEIYYEMVIADIDPSPFILSEVLNACVGVLGLNEGKEIHGRTIKAGYILSESLVIASLVKLYISCGELEYADKLMKC